MQRKIRRNRQRMLEGMVKRQFIGSAYHPHLPSYVLNPAGYEHAYGYCRTCGCAIRRFPQPK